MEPEHDLAYVYIQAHTNKPQQTRQSSMCCCVLLVITVFTVNGIGIAHNPALGPLQQESAFVTVCLFCPACVQRAWQGRGRRTGPQQLPQTSNVREHSLQCSLFLPQW